MGTMKNFDWREVENDESSLPEADPMIRQAGGTGGFDTARLLAGYPFTGTGSKQELVELEGNMRSLIEEGTYGYKYIEDFLIHIGYNQNKVRSIFRKLTGVEPEDFVNIQSFMDTPGTIPGINYGWGKAKGGKHDYLFIMPYDIGYGVFGQKGDLQREEVSHFASLAEATQELEKKTTDTQIFDKIVTKKDLKKDKELNHRDLAEPLPIGTKTASYRKLEDYLIPLSAQMNPIEKQAILNQALSDGEITKEEYKSLAIESKLINPSWMNSTLERSAIDTVAEEGAEEVFKAVEETLRKPSEIEIGEITPQQHFETIESGTTSVKTAHIEEVLNYIVEKNDELRDFSLDTKSFKFIKKDSSARIEKAPEVGEGKVEEYFSSTGVISVVAAVTAKVIPAPNNKKDILMVFAVVDGEVVGDGTFKGTDNKIYGLEEEGLEKYFRTEKERYAGEGKLF